MNEIDRLVKESLEKIPKDNYRLRDEVIRLGRFLRASDISVEEQVQASGALKKIHDRVVPDLPKQSDFLIPKEWLEHAKKWVNAGGNPSAGALARALDYDLPPLTDLQRKALYDAIDHKGGADYILDDIKRRGDRRSSKYVARRYNSLDRELIAQALSKKLKSDKKINYDLNPDAIFGKRSQPNIYTTLENLHEANRLAKQKATSEALRKGFKVIKGGLKFLGPVGFGIGAAMDAKDAYALGESTMNPKTEEDLARQKALADLMRRNEFY